MGWIDATIPLSTTPHCCSHAFLQSRFCPAIGQWSQQTMDWKPLKLWAKSNLLSVKSLMQVFCHHGEKVT
jgi:hypothetical protein